MATNGEWLDYLAQNAPDELAAWFDAEHVEHQERTLDGDTAALEVEYGKGGVVGGSFCDTPEQGEVVMPLESWREYLRAEPENEDSRDKIEADVRKIADAYNMDTQRHGTERFADELYHSIIHLLNRQMAIDDSICDECSSDFYKLQEDYDKLVDEVDELTAERDELKERADYNSHGWAKANIGWAEANAEAEKWQMKCDEYRSKFGKCLDYADAIHALMDDEGVA